MGADHEQFRLAAVSGRPFPAWGAAATQAFGPVVVETADGTEQTIVIDSAEQTISFDAADWNGADEWRRREQKEEEDGTRGRKRKRRQEEEEGGETRKSADGSAPKTI